MACVVVWAYTFTVFDYVQHTSRSQDNMRTLSGVGMLVLVASYNVDDPGADHGSHAIELDANGDAVGAISSFRAEARFHPSSEAWFNVGVALLTAPQDVATATEAASALKAALQLDPENLNVVLRLPTAEPHSVTLTTECL
jgi:hypothetical protein